MSSSETECMTQSQARADQIVDNINDNSHKIDRKNENDQGLTCVCGKGFCNKSNLASN